MFGPKPGAKRGMREASAMVSLPFYRGCMGEKQQAHQVTFSSMFGGVRAASGGAQAGRGVHTDMFQQFTVAYCRIIGFPPVPTEEGKV